MHRITRRDVRKYRRRTLVIFTIQGVRDREKWVRHRVEQERPMPVFHKERARDNNGNDHRIRRRLFNSGIKLLHLRNVDKVDIGIRSGGRWQTEETIGNEI